jgi:hypothetical protein
VSKPASKPMISCWSMQRRLAPTLLSVSDTALGSRRLRLPPSRNGARLSSPLVNVLWGSCNLGAGVALLSASPITIELSAPLLVFAFGFLGLGAFLALRFGKVMEHRRE